LQSFGVESPFEPEKVMGGARVIGTIRATF
jgi:hypothetical protein